MKFSGLKVVKTPNVFRRVKNSFRNIKLYGYFCAVVSESSLSGGVSSNKNVKVILRIES